MLTIWTFFLISFESALHVFVARDLFIDLLVERNEEKMTGLNGRQWQEMDGEKMNKIKRKEKKKKESERKKKRWNNEKTGLAHNFNFISMR